MKTIPGGITAPKGYTAAGIHAGIKKAKKDLALIISRTPAVCAGAFTRNVVQAAPVIWDRRIVEGHGTVRAILINSGNANACTGDQGMRDCTAMAELTAQKLTEQLDSEISPLQVCICSTGVIGVPLPMDTIAGGIDTITPLTGSTPGHADDAATAICTTDTFTKEIAIEIMIGNRPVRIAGMAKGSGMIHPDMATMLSFIVTDAAISQDLLQRYVGSSIAESYNMISVDGDTSTNDTVLVLANGASGAQEIIEGTEEAKIFKEAFDAVHTHLAKEIVRDGEGAGKFIEVVVHQASSDQDAKIIAKSVITSNLVKTAFFGEDANWGRILCAMGYSGAQFDPLRVSLSLNSSAGTILLLEEGTPLAFDEQQALQVLKEHEIQVIIEMNARGSGSAVAWGCDLSYEYVRINGEYRS
jgi:glutamate N-acetyltransferase / amino-acid N-acetyltransferase